jgi:hypothetical protein
MSVSVSGGSSARHELVEVRPVSSVLKLELAAVLADLVLMPSS